MHLAPPAAPRPDTSPAAPQASSQPPERRRGPHLPAALAPLRIPAYRTYVTGQALNNTGQWTASVAQDWLVLSLTHDSTAVGLVMAAQFGPSLALSAMGGSIADALPRRRVLAVTGSVWSLLTGLLALTCVLGTVTAWQVYVIAAAGGIAAAIDAPARQAFVGDVASQEHLREAISLNAAVFQTTRLVGPALAAVLLSTVGAGWAFAVASACALGPLAALARLKPATGSPAAHHAGGRPTIGAALRHVADRPQVAWTIVLVAVVGTFGLNFPIVLSAMAAHTFGGGVASAASATNGDVGGRGADLYGMFNIVLAVGSATGAILASGRRNVRLRVLILATVAFGLAQAGAALAPDLVTFCVLIAAMGVGNLFLQALANSSVQLWCEPAFRGRVMGLYLLVFVGGTPIGAPIVGWVTANLGARAGMTLCGVVPMVVAVAVAGVLAIHHRPSLINRLVPVPVHR